MRASGAKTPERPTGEKSILKDAGVMGYELKPSDVYDLARVLDADVHEKGGELFFTYCPYCRGGESRDKNTFSVNLTSGAFNAFAADAGRPGISWSWPGIFTTSWILTIPPARRCTGSCPSARSPSGKARLYIFSPAALAGQL